MRSFYSREAKTVANERIQSILQEEQIESDNESFSEPISKNKIPQQFVGVAMKFLYLIKKMEMSETRDDKKVVFIDMMELCMENPGFIVECNSFKQILYKKMNDFEDVICKEENKINEVRVDKKLVKLMKSVNESIPNVIERAKIIALLSNAHLIHSKYTGPNSLNYRVLLAINSVRDTMNKY